MVHVKEKFGALCWWQGSLRSLVARARWWQGLAGGKGCAGGRAAASSSGCHIERASYSPTAVSYGIHPTACRRAKQRSRRLQYGRE